jgi:hypothetical protein
MGFMYTLKLAIRILYAELAKRDRVIASLEDLEAQRYPARAPKKRGRKSMGKKERRDVSARMKKYWAGRRQAAAEVNAEKSEQELVDQMRKTQKEYRQAAEEFANARVEFADMLNHPDGALALSKAATKERVAARKYRKAVHAYGQKIAPDLPPAGNNGSAKPGSSEE